MFNIYDTGYRSDGHLTWQNRYNVNFKKVWGTYD